MPSSFESDRAAQPSGRRSAKKSHTLLLPFLIVVTTLIISSARESVSLHNQKINIDTQYQQSIQKLGNSAKQVEAMQNLQKDLEKLSATDPIAAKIVADYFPAPASVSPAPTNP